MGLPRTSAGIFAGAVAKRAFEVAKENKDDPATWITATAVGSVAAGTAYHVLKPEVQDIFGAFGRKRSGLTLED